MPRGYAGELTDGMTCGGALWPGTLRRTAHVSSARTLVSHRLYILRSHVDSVRARDSRRQLAGADQTYDRTLTDP